MIGYPEMPHAFLLGSLFVKPHIINIYWGLAHRYWSTRPLNMSLNVDCLHKTYPRVTDAKVHTFMAKFGHESVIATYLRLGKRQVQRPEDGPLQEPLSQDEVEARLNCNSDCDDRTSRGRQRPRQRQR